MTLRSYLNIIRERWKLVVLMTSLATGLGVLLVALTPNTYQSRAQVFVSPSASTDPLAQYQAATVVQAQVATFAQIIDSPPVLKAVRSDLNLALTDQQLKSKITATSTTGSTLINIYATDRSAGRASSIANSASRAFVKAIQDYTKGKSGKSTVQLAVTDPAVAASKPISPKPLLNVSLGIFLGLLVGIALAVTREVLDNRVKNPESLAKAAEAPLMGVVVEDPAAARHPIATRAGTRNVRSENFRQVRANLQFANVDKHPRVIAIASSVPSEGKTMVAMNLASTLAEAGFVVCLVDADLRRPMIAKTMGLASPVGLTNVLIHQLDLTEALQSAGANFYVLSSGPTPPNPSEVLASSYVREIITALLDKVDYVIIDTAPLLAVADGAEVAALADGTLLVARHKVTTEPQIKRAVAALHRVDANLLGVVLNRQPNTRHSYYGYSYYRADPETRRPGPTPARGKRLGRARAGTGAR